MTSYDFTMTFIDDEAFGIEFESEPDFRAAMGATYSPISVEQYVGTVNVTPSSERHILQTKNKVVITDIVVDPIPCNYGLITWDGSTITVS